MDLNVLVERDGLHIKDSDGTKRDQLREEMRPTEHVDGWRIGHRGEGDR